MWHSINNWKVIFEKIELPERLKKLYNEYNEAKASKDFEKSDNLRKLLIEKNIL